jgi:hypothetical protein
MGGHPSPLDNSGSVSVANWVMLSDMKCQPILFEYYSYQYHTPREGRHFIIAMTETHNPKK